ncbi:MAG TPA: DUF4384 domain-containing protein [Leptospiraceae bacterium]|nr:DUF4384 domain-containing protein [Leptospirales bacterium]HMU82626.1 DUF4384 domain-containing protein [Leptospiraceae bacterium]HMW61713.1 DUF4384 domain-containing protein [Leptospiraceae bacterium]HMY44711.1 DUF4384 domain-containing protein [Leptospiraceae bacterium]HNE21904.1 DUF4384 domain-containing protein [Leptospiraceae bacterium]
MIGRPTVAVRRHLLLLLVLATPLWSQAPRQPVIAILPFQAKDSARGEELASRLTAEIVARQAFPVAERAQLKKALEELAKGQTGLFQPENAPQLGRMIGADYLILGEILDSTDKGGVRASMRVVRAETGIVIGAAVTGGEADAVSRDLSLSAIKTVSIHAMLENPDSPYSVLLLLDKGKNPEYKLGETLRLKFKVLKHDQTASEKVYLSIYSINADGVMTLIYPNRFSGQEGVYVGREYTFPDPRDDFEWKLVPPAGAETLQAIVSNKPVRLANERATEDFPVLGVKESPALYRGIQTQLKEEKRGNWAAERITYILKP